MTGFEIIPPSERRPMLPDGQPSPAPEQPESSPSAEPPASPEVAPAPARGGPTARRTPSAAPTSTPGDTPGSEATRGDAPSPAEQLEQAARLTQQGASDAAPPSNGESPAQTASESAAAAMTSSTGPRPALSVRGLTVRYETRASLSGPNASLASRVRGYDRRSVRALADVSFTAYEGDRIGVVGTNGSGKTTMLRAIAGLLPYEAGTVTSAAQPVFLGATGGMRHRLSGRDNIIIGLIGLGIRKVDAELMVGDIGRFSDLLDRLDEPVGTYSTGMRARLRTSIALAAEPAILIVDETLVVGDGQFRQRAQNVMNRRLDAASVVFVVSHQLDHIRKMSDRVLWIHRGHLAADGPRKEVLPRYRRFVNGEGRNAKADATNPAAAKGGGAPGAGKPKRPRKAQPRSRRPGR